MNFARSSQRKSWIFSPDSLHACKARAAGGSTGGHGRVQKYASGFHQQWQQPQPTPTQPAPTPTEGRGSGVLSARDQETLVQFHAHQIQTLVGPYALMSELRRSQKVLSTAVVLFRRFFLSNSVVEFSPRKIATSAAFLAAKLEEERVEISLLAHATCLVQRRVRHAPLCRTELESVSLAQIEEGERELMEGVNYEFICHHPDDQMQGLFADVIDFMGEQQQLCQSSLAVSDGLRDDPSETTGGTASCEPSPRSVDALSELERPEDMMENVMDAVNQTLIFSDAPFLFSPEAIAYAVVCIETRSFAKDYQMGDLMQSYLIARHPEQSQDEILRFSKQVGQAIACLLECQDLDLLPGQKRSSNVIAQRAEQLRRVLVQVADLRLLYQMHRPTMGRYRRDCRSRRKRRSDYGYFPSHFSMAMASAGQQPPVHRKMARVTPTTNQNNMGIIY